MRPYQNQSAEKAKRKSRKKDQDALKNVVSLRISDQEKEVLDQCTKATRKNVSDVVREAIELWLTKHKPLLS
jgi:uncharacterized protein (DUF1778 family)